MTVSSGDGLALRQLRALVRLEMVRALGWRRSLWLLFLAFAPLVIIVAHAIEDTHHHQRAGMVADGGQGELLALRQLSQEGVVLAAIIQVFYVRFGIFFGCLGLAMSLFRGEIATKTLHYAFLAPLRREVLVLGKFLAAALTTIVLFGAGVAASFLLMYAHIPEGRDFLLAGPAPRHLAAYLLATVLACLGYLALSLALSLVFKNPVIPAVIIVLWEGINGILPVWLKRFSVTYYLKPIFPVELPVGGISGLFTIVSEPVPVWLCVVGLLAFTALTLAFACWRVRRLEISYATE